MNIQIESKTWLANLVRLNNIAIARLLSEIIQIQIMYNHNDTNYLRTTVIRSCLS